MGVTAAVTATVAGVNSITGGAITNAIGLGPDSGGGAVTGTNPDGSSIYDPYGAYRGSAATSLNALVNNPALALGDPGYQMALNQGIQATERGAASKGMMMSGNETAALANLGQSTFGSYYNSKIANLMQLSGASQNPAAAAQAQTQAALANAQIQNANVNMMSSGLGQVAGGLKSIYNNPTTSYDMLNISGPNNFSGFDVNSTTTPGFWQDYSYD